MESKTNQRADSTRFRRATDDDPPIGAYNDNYTYIVDLDSGTWRVDITNPTCPECRSGNVRYDHRSDVVCRSCGMVLSAGKRLVRDRVAAAQIKHNTGER